MNTLTFLTRVLPVSEIVDVLLNGEPRVHVGVEHPTQLTRQMLNTGNIQRVNLFSLGAYRAVC